MAGSLIVVGTGIEFDRHLSLGARRAIASADIVYYVLDNPAAEQWIESVARAAVSLRAIEEDPSALRTEVYDRMADTIVESVREGKAVCAVFYGHPGILVCPTHRAIVLARREGFSASMLPAISAVDAFFADLCIDPAESGWQCFDASDLLLNKRRYDPRSILIVFQAAMVGTPYYRDYRPVGLPLFVETLRRDYPADHEIVLYEAALDGETAPRIERCALDALVDARLTPATLLYIPPLPTPSIDFEIAVRLARLYAEESKS